MLQLANSELRMEQHRGGRTITRAPNKAHKIEPLIDLPSWWCFEDETPSPPHGLRCDVDNWAGGRCLRPFFKGVLYAVCSLDSAFVNPALVKKLLSSFAI